MDCCATWSCSLKGLQGIIFQFKIYQMECEIWLIEIPSKLFTWDRIEGTPENWILRSFRNEFLLETFKEFKKYLNGNLFHFQKSLKIKVLWSIFKTLELILEHKYFILLLAWKVVKLSLKLYWTKAVLKYPSSLTLFSNFNSILRERRLSSSLDSEPWNEWL